MNAQIFVNLPVEFFTKLGYTFNPQFTNEDATGMIVGENIFVMLLVEKFFQTFIDKPISDAKKSTEVLMGLSCASRAEMDEMVRKAVAAGGTSPRCR
jgi:predicted lactoylglutathione lyase